MSISEEAKTFIEIMEGNIVHKIGSDVLRKNHMEDDKDSFKTVSNRIARKMSGEENDQQMNDMQSLTEEFAKVVLEEYYEKQRKKMMKDTSQMNPETVSTETPRGRNINKYSIDAVGKRLQKDFLQGQVKNWTDKGLGDSGMVQKTKEKLRELSGRDYK